MLNCLECGACCRAFGIVEVTEPDDIPQELTTFTELGYSRMRTNGFTCCCLTADNRCTIYSGRPGICRRLVIGGDLCRMARHREGII